MHKFFGLLMLLGLPYYLVHVYNEKLRERVADCMTDLVEDGVPIDHARFKCAK